MALLEQDVFLGKREVKDDERNGAVDESRERKMDVVDRYVRCVVEVRGFWPFQRYVASVEAINVSRGPLHPSCRAEFPVHPRCLVFPGRRPARGKPAVAWVRVTIEHLTDEYAYVHFHTPDPDTPDPFETAVVEPETLHTRAELALGAGATSEQ